MSLASISRGITSVPYQAHLIIEQVSQWNCCQLISISADKSYSFKIKDTTAGLSEQACFLIQWYHICCIISCRSFVPNKVKKSHFFSILPLSKQCPTIISRQNEKMSYAKSPLQWKQVLHICSMGKTCTMLYRKPHILAVEVHQGWHLSALKHKVYLSNPRDPWSSTFSTGNDMVENRH